MTLVWTRVLMAILATGLTSDIFWAAANENGPDIAIGCVSMIPSFEFPGQASPPPFSITFSPDQYTPGTIVSVTVKACTSTAFKGFLIQTRRATVGSNQNELIGSFTPVPGTQFACQKRGLINTDDSDKTKLTFNWNPPPSAQGPVQFRVTFMEVSSMYWSAVTSAVLLDNSTDTPDPDSLMTPSTLAPECHDDSLPNGVVERPSECGSSKGCVSDCSGSSCTSVISWEHDGDYVFYTISSVVSLPSYLAIGFSSDTLMGSDSVSGCASGSDNTIKIFNGVNRDETDPIQFEDPNVTLIDSRISDGIMNCKIKRLKNASVDGKRFDVTKKWYILFARGPSEIDGRTIKLFDHGHKDFVSARKFSSDDMPNAGVRDTAEYLIIKAHGSFMIVAWIFLASIGIVIARYYKPVWTKDLCSQQVWFQIHRISMVLVVMSTAVGFVLITIKEHHEYHETHQLLGLICTILTVLNPIIAILRPQPGTDKRCLFSWAHWFVGNAAHLLGVIAIFFGVKLHKSDAPDSMVYLLLGYVAWQFLISIVLEIMQVYGLRKAREELFELDDTSAQDAIPLIQTTKMVAVKRVLLLVHVIVLTAFSAILIIFLCVGEEKMEQ